MRGANHHPASSDLAAFDAAGWDSGSSTRVLRHLWRGRWIVLGLTLGSLLSGLVVLEGVPGLWGGLEPRYRATARLVVSNREVDLLRGEGAAGTKPVSMLNQQRALIRSEAILRPLSEVPELQDLKSLRAGGRSVLAALNESLQASIDTRSDLLQIHFEGPSPEDAMVVADAAVQVYLDYHRQRKEEETRLFIGLLDEEVARKVEEREGLQHRIEALKRENLALIGSTGESNLATEQLQATSQALTAARQQVVKAQASRESILEAKEGSRERFREYGAYYRNTSPSPVLEDEIAPITSARIEAETEYAKRLASGDTEALLKNKREEIEFLREREQAIIERYAETFLQSTEISLREAEREVAHWRQAYLGLEDEVLEVVKAGEQLSLLQGRLETVQAELDARVARISELGLAEGTGGLNIHVLERARAAGKPVFPDPVQVLGIAVALGLFTGLGIAFLRGALDRRVLSLDDVEGLTGESVLAVLPRVPAAERERLGRVVDEDPGSLAAEAVRTLRTAVGLGLPHGGRGIVLVTSAVEGEGKSVFASNLALALGQSGRRTILVDADLRSPGQSAIHGLGELAGVGEVLTGLVSTREAIVEGVGRDVDLLAAGAPQERVAELLEGPNMRQLANWLRKQYDCVVVDAPPVLLTSEARVLAALADLTLFVLRLEHSTTPDVLRAREVLHAVDARLLGLLVNDERTRRRSSYAGGLGHAVSAPPPSGRGPGEEGHDEPGAGLTLARGDDPEPGERVA